MAAQLFNRIGQLGLGVALVGGVVNSALYNGMYYLSNLFRSLGIKYNLCLIINFYDIVTFNKKTENSYLSAQFTQVLLLPPVG